MDSKGLKGMAPHDVDVTAGGDPYDGTGEDKDGEGGGHNTLEGGKGGEDGGGKQGQ